MNKGKENKVLLAVMFSGNYADEIETEVIYDYTNNLSIGETCINDSVYSTLGYSKKLEGTTDLSYIYRRVIREYDDDYSGIQDCEGVIVDGEYYFN